MSRVRSLFATDLDGTILPHEGQFNVCDVDTLNQMGQNGIIRVIATGRSLHYAFKVLKNDFPIDYLVFSSGAGVYDWRKKEILRTLHLNRAQIGQIIDVFNLRGLGYTLHQNIPGNHYFWHKAALKQHPDLTRFINSRLDFAKPIGELNEKEEFFSQMLTMIDEPCDAHIISKQLVNVKTVRATSPLDGKSIWIEVFHRDASKASGIDLICEIENIAESNVWVLGNDYNDIDMLNRYFPRAFVVENAPADLKEKYKVVPAVYDAGMSVLVKEYLQ